MAKSHFELLQDKALPLSTYNQFSYGSYQHPSRTFIVSPDCVARVSWREDADWKYYPKSYGKPKTTISGRCVEFFTRDGKIVTHELKNFMGAFMEAAVAAYMGVVPCKASKMLAPVQLNNVFSVTYVRDFEGGTLYSRNIGTVLWDFCARSHDGATYHHAEAEGAIIALGEKVGKMQKQKEAEEKQKMSADYLVDKFGFCKSGIARFCEINNLDIHAIYSIAQLREAVGKKKKQNTDLFSSELRAMGVI